MPCACDMVVIVFVRVCARFCACVFLTVCALVCLFDLV